MSQPDRSFVEKGASAHFDLAFDGTSETFYFLLLPKTTMLAVAAAIEPLRIANQLTSKPLYQWFTLSEDGGVITCSNGLKVTPDYALETNLSQGRCFVCAGVEPEKSTSKRSLGWIRREARFGRPFGGICTGSFALAQAGLIKDQYFTLHWENQHSFRDAFPELDPSNRLYEIDDDLITCGGGNAAIDMMLALIEAKHGAELATVVADMCIHMRASSVTTPQTTAHSAAIGSRNPHLIATLELMQGNTEDPLSMSEICELLDISRRQIERLFTRYVQQSPMQTYLDIRLSRALSYVKETNMTVAEIAASTGFSSADHFSRRFRARYGTTPRTYRTSWS